MAERGRSEMFHRKTCTCEKCVEKTLRKLEKEGLVKREGGGWLPVEDTEDD